MFVGYDFEHSSTSLAAFCELRGHRGIFRNPLKAIIAAAKSKKNVFLHCFLNMIVMVLHTSLLRSKSAS